MNCFEALELCGVRWPRSGFLSCPAHVDKTPSLKLYQDSFYCFSCGANGDGYGLIALLQGKDIAEVLRTYGSRDRARQASRKVVDLVGPHAADQRLRRRITEVNAAVFAALHDAFHFEQTTVLVDQIEREWERFEEFLASLDGRPLREIEAALDLYEREALDWFDKEQDRLAPWSQVEAKFEAIDRQAPSARLGGASSLPSNLEGATRDDTQRREGERSGQE